jgi:transcriptional regulator with XRE-family HTH domain
MTTLGQELRRLRTLRGWTLRDVEEKTKKKVSNSYLYQLENDNVKEPSPKILFVLASTYGAPYPDLMRLAGFVMPLKEPQSTKHRASVAFSSLDLTPEEEEKVLDFVEFLRAKKGKR